MKKNYKKVHRENITKKYKKCSPEAKREINCEANVIIQDLRLEDKVDCYAERKSYVTFKDHKKNFKNDLPCRLINPAKSEIGIISRNILQRINKRVRKETGLLQWRETKKVIDWFKGITKKNKRKFLKFDIVDFYPSISKDILLRSIDFAKKCSRKRRKKLI